MTSEIPAGALEGARTIFETAGLTGNRLALALDNIYKRHVGYSALKAGEIDIYLTAAEIAAHLGLTTGQVNERLADEGFQRLVDDGWEALKPGFPYACFDNDGLKWNSTILDAIEEWI
ncbi:MAG: hypothetical protein IJP54_05955 [Synergistaceae bacterium]|nr:hypothetical protein [Synergistaceae bacterium]MBQ6419136.1 hypothetical protein [Synergistaceae bacterium]MBR0035199.1 hypothetical protein [Synergistaceae bacterium]